MLLELITEPGVEPIDAAEVKSRLGLGDDVSDEIIGAYITAARQNIDGGNGWLGRCLVQQGWLLSMACFPYGGIRIPLPPLITVDSVKYYDDDGVQQEWPSDQYRIVGQRLSPLSGVSFPSTQTRDDAIEIEFTAGYGDEGSSVPEPIRQAIVLMVSHMRSMSERNLFLQSERVEGIDERTYVVGGNAGAAIESAVQSLLATYRVFA